MSATALEIREMTLGNLLRRRASEYGEKTYLEFVDQSFSYDEALARSEAAAAKLRGLGVEHGDRVCLMLDNHPDYLWMVYGAALIGAIAVPLNTATKGAQLGYFLGDCDPTVLIVEPHLVDRLPDGVDAQVVVYDGGEGGADAELRWGSIDPTEAGADAVEPRFPDLFLIMYTSGTTGPSKGVMCPHAHPLSVARYVNEGFKLDDTDRMYVSQPLFHSAALWWGCLGALWGGGTVILAPRFSASGFWRDISEHGATWFIAVMSMVGILQKREVDEYERTNPARQGFIIPVPENRREYEERTGVVITTNYAMSEIHPVALLGPDDGGYDRPGTAGRVCDHDEVRIVDEDDMELPPGEIGEIIVRPRDPWSFFRGYWRKPEATAEAMVNSWFHTGDLASVDADGYLYFKGRRKDAIRRRGENISSQEVEAAINSHPGIADSAVIGIESDLGEQDVAAFVVRKDTGISERDVIEHAADNMAYYMVPRYVSFLEELPQTESFKIKKFVLAERAESDPGQLWDREAAGISVGRDGVTQR
jgi:carnitine-CoA ligase